MEKGICVFLLLLLFSGSAASLEPGQRLVIRARLSVTGGEVKADEIRLVFSSSESEPGDEYIAKILDAGMQTIYQTKFSFREMVVKMPEKIPEDEVEDYYDKTQGRLEAHLFLPYFKEAAILVVGRQGEKPIAFIDLKSRLCNDDGECNKSENFLSCGDDCPLEEEDNYCYPETDGICDPDCIGGLDLDCAPGQGNGADGGGTEGLSLAEYYFIGAVAFTVIVIALYTLLKRKRKSR